jgi:predicted nucleic acid-binding Zn finger protein
MNIYEWITSQEGTKFVFEERRVERARELFHSSLTIEPRSVRASIVRYEQYIHLEASFTTKAVLVGAHCTCPDYEQRYYTGGDYVQPCKHLIRLMQEVAIEDLDASAALLAPIASIPGALTDADEAISTGDSFSERLTNAIDQVVSALAKEVVEILETGRVPFLVGPTGTGKTSAVSKAALMLDARFYESAGSDAWTDSDLVGVKMPNGDLMPGPIGAAMMHAQMMGEQVLIFLDEFLRFSPRAQESLMRVLQPKSMEIASAMGIDYHGPIRVTSAPFWGETWAPAEFVHICLAANPWGTIPDPALLRRVEPINVEFSQMVLSLFKGKAQDAIKISWQGVADGSLPLPIEYSQLARAKDEEDLSFLDQYLARVRVIDPAAEKAFATLLHNTKSV